MQEILLIIKKNNAAQTPVMFLFERKGVILLDAPETEVDNIMMEAADLEGVEDVFYRQPDEDGEKGAVEIRVEPEATAAITTAIKNHSGIPFDVIKAGIEVIPNEDTLTDGPTGDKDCADLSKLLGSYPGWPNFLRLHLTRNRATRRKRRRHGIVHQSAKVMEGMSM